jgi:hypothetical protein
VRDRDYEVGYGKPPKKNQFKPGTSGNPKGRPKKSRFNPPATLDPFVNDALNVFGELVPVIQNGKPGQAPLLAAALKKKGLDGLRSNPTALNQFLGIAERVGKTVAEERRKAAEYVERYKQHWEPKFAAALAAGRAEPTDLPHPDHVNFSLEAMDVQVSGPLNAAEKRNWDLVKNSLRVLDEKRQALRARVDSGTQIPEEIAELATIEDIIRWTERNQVPPGWNWHECVSDADRAYYADCERRLRERSQGD